MDVRDWLRGLGLERYEQAFHDNEVDSDVFPDLTADDLTDLGCRSIGHRRPTAPRDREPCSGCSPRAGPGARSNPASALGPAGIPTPDAERRQLTVMFFDLVGSTALSARLDPEDMREVIRAYQNAVAGEITRSRVTSPSTWATACSPISAGRGPMRTMPSGRCAPGWRSSQAVGQLSTPTGEALAARVGIATGLVVVGDLIGEGAAQEQAVVGDTPNLAARLQALAEPGTGGDRRRRRGGCSAAASSSRIWAQRTLKGIGEPVRAFAVVGERPLESRFEARSGPALLPMVGRDQELALLLERWAQAKAGEGQGVLLVGEAGIGKSRIAAALLDALAEEPHVRVRYQCSPYHTDSALWPVIQQLSHAAGWSADDPIEARLDKLEALLGRAGGREAGTADRRSARARWRGALRPLDLTPQLQRARTLEALVDQLLGLAARQPVLVVLEDAHWIDPTTLELIEQCLDRIATPGSWSCSPAGRPAAGLGGHPHVTRLTLNRLGRAGVEAIVARLGGGHLPGETIDAIIARTDGVPLFVEELTKAVLETGETSDPGLAARLP